MYQNMLALYFTSDDIHTYVQHPNGSFGVMFFCCCNVIAIIYNATNNTNDDD